MLVALNNTATSVHGRQKNLNRFTLKHMQNDNLGSWQRIQQCSHFWSVRLNSDVQGYEHDTLHSRAVIVSEYNQFAKTAHNLHPAQIRALELMQLLLNGNCNGLDNGFAKSCRREAHTTKLSCLRENIAKHIMNFWATMLSLTAPFCMSNTSAAPFANGLIIQEGSFVDSWQ